VAAAEITFLRVYYAAFYQSKCVHMTESELAGFPPKLYLIGAQKCATTFFADLLAQHPSIELSTTKEPDFFTVHRDKGLDWYRERFSARDGRVLLDASPSYTAAPTDPAERHHDNPRFGVPQRIKAVAPDARFIYLVRDPVARSYSAYWHHVRIGEETRPYLQAIREKSWYLDLSRYHFQLMEYLAVFPEEAMLVLDAKQVTRDPDTAVAAVCAHAGLKPPEHPIEAGGRRNPSYRYNALGRAVTRSPTARRGLKAATRLLRAGLPAGAFDKLRRSLTKSIPPMSAKEQRVTYGYLAEDMERFSKRTGIGFSVDNTHNPGGPASESQLLSE